MTDPITPEPSESILRRVRNLLDRAEHAGTNEHERELSMAKATKLMAEYGIQRAMLAAAGGADDPIDGTKIDITDPYSFEKGSLLASVALALRCKVVRTSYGKRTSFMTMVGAASDRERAEMLYTSLLLQAESGMLRQPRGWNATETRRIRAGFLAGFARIIGWRLEEAEARAAHDYDTARAAAGPARSHEAGTAMVLADRTALVEQRYTELFPKLDKGRSRSYDRSALREGAEAARRADIGTTRVAGAKSRSLEGAR